MRSRYPAAEFRHDLPGRFGLGGFSSFRKSRLPRRRTWSGWHRRAASFATFYVPQAICSASRSALLSGCYPGRTKVFGAHPPRARGLDPKFATLGQVMKTAGYRTAVFGKWHIGDQPDTRPPARGFDESCGLMYSNDMWEFHPWRSAKLGEVSAAVLGERQGEHRARDQGAPADAHHLVHRARRRLHQAQ